MKNTVASGRHGCLCLITVCLILSQLWLLALPTEASTFCIVTVFFPLWLHIDALYLLYCILQNAHSAMWWKTKLKAIMLIDLPLLTQFDIQVNTTIPGTENRSSYQTSLLPLFLYAPCYTVTVLLVNTPKLTTHHLKHSLLLFFLSFTCVNMHTHVCLHSVFRSCIIPNSPLLCSSAHGYFYFPPNPFPDKFPLTLETHLEYNMHYWIFPNSPMEDHIFLHLCLSIRFFFHW